MFGCCVYCFCFDLLVRSFEVFSCRPNFEHVSLTFNQCNHVCVQGWAQRTFNSADSQTGCLFQIWRLPLRKRLRVNPFFLCKESDFSFHFLLFDIICSRCLFISQRLCVNMSIRMKHIVCIYCLFTCIACKNNHSSFHVYSIAALLKLQVVDVK